MRAGPGAGWALRRYDDLARSVLGRAGRLGAVRLVAVDGPSGAGKSFFADHLRSAFVRSGTRVEIVHTDDLLDGWDDQVSFWPTLEERVLAPLRAGRDGGFEPYDWLTGRPSGTWTVVPRCGVLILEGVTAGRGAVRPELSCGVFVTAPLDLRVSRVAHRDGAAVDGYMPRWRAVEERFFAADDTAASADVVVCGAPTGTRHDPASEFVCRGPGTPGPVRHF